MRVECVPMLSAFISKRSIDQLILWWRCDSPEQRRKAPSNLSGEYVAHDIHELMFLKAVNWWGF
jgi:hypothetical protein